MYRGRQNMTPVAMATVPDLAGPLVDAADDPLMDLPEVGQVVAGRDGRFVQQDQGRMSDLPLRGLQLGGGAQPELRPRAAER
jgi:hypothetical protein